MSTLQNSVLTYFCEVKLGEHAGCLCICLYEKVLISNYYMLLHDYLLPEHIVVAMTSGCVVFSNMQSGGLLRPC